VSDVAHFENEAEAARARIVDAIEQLSDRLSPQTIIREARDEGRKALLDARDEGVEALMGLRDRAADTLEDVERTIVQHPALFALGAVALGVAVTAGRRAARGSGRPAEPGDEYARYAMGDNYAADAMHVGERGRSMRARAAENWGSTREALVERTVAAARCATSAAAEARDRASAKLADVSGSLRARVADAAGSIGTHADDVGERVAAALDRARDGATDAAEAVTRGVRKGAANTRDAIHDNPEATIAIGVAVGIVLALVTGDRPFDTDDREV